VHGRIFENRTAMNELGKRGSLPEMEASRLLELSSVLISQRNLRFPYSHFAFVSVRYIELCGSGMRWDERGVPGVLGV